MACDLVIGLLTSGIPDETNFFGSIRGPVTVSDVAQLFREGGWRIVEPDDWDHLEARCLWAELVIEGFNPILVHGPVADVVPNSSLILDILERTGCYCSAEWYGRGGDLLGSGIRPEGAAQQLER